VLGVPRAGADKAFTSCRVAGRVINPYGVQNEESQYRPDILVCSGLRMSWPEFWKKFQNFG
jgi:hypothetical protein